MQVEDQLNRDWTDISSEKYRTYVYPDGYEMTIQVPQFLNVSESGSHRILSHENGGTSWYVAPGWIGIRWETSEGKPNFVK